MKHLDVLHDPIFHDLLQRHARAARRLRDSVLALRSWHLDHGKHPGEETVSEKWRSASLQEDCVKAFEFERDTAEELLNYGFELAFHSSENEHIEDIRSKIAAHKKRLEEKTGWGSRPIELRGPEERIKIDDGPPITIVMKPKQPE
jgi:hypothetical protein